MAIFTLTTGPDTFVDGAGANTVYGTAATLNAGDSLTGGSGNNVLELIGSGSFYVSQLASFTGFQSIKLDNATNSFASLTLGSQPIEVDVSGYLSISVNSPSNWNADDIINGDSTYSWTSTSLQFYNYQSYPPPSVSYDLTSTVLSHVNLYAGGNDFIFTINNFDTAGVQSFSAGGQNDQLVTAGSTLDLSHTTVSGFTVASTNPLGTTFTVGDLGTAFQIAGGPGNDTLIAQGFTFTPDQRSTIFATSSIETISDNSGTYYKTAPSVAPTVAVSINNTDVNVANGTGTVTLAFSEAPVAFA